MHCHWNTELSQASHTQGSRVVRFCDTFGDKRSCHEEEEILSGRTVPSFVEEVATKQSLSKSQHLDLRQTRRHSRRGAAQWLVGGNRKGQQSELGEVRAASVWNE